MRLEIFSKRVFGTDPRSSVLFGAARSNMFDARSSWGDTPQSRGHKAATAAKRLIIGGAVLVMALACGCASQPALPQQAPRPANRYIYVTSEGLPGDCYTDLGPIQISQPFAKAAVDEDNSDTAKRLRALAMDSYPADVDAVIGVQADQNDVGSQVTVKGEAVRLEDHPTVQCTLRGAKGAMDQAAVLGAAGIAGATAGGLMAGASAATSAGIAGATLMGAHQLVQRMQEKQQIDDQLKAELDDQHRQIDRLLKQRSRLQQCKQAEISLSACLASGADAGAPGLSAEGADQSAEEPATYTSTAMPFEVRRQIQEQQDYIKKLEAQISQLKFDIGGH